MMGHTDKATINQRRPLTAGMRRLLEEMAANRLGKHGKEGHRLYQSDGDRARALMDRGLALPDEHGWWSATPAGRAYLEANP